MSRTLVTGASGGIGERIAFRIAETKEDLVLVARSEKKLQALCHDLKAKYGIEADYVTCDLSDPDAPVRLYKECSERGYQIRSLINNAGIGSGGEFAGSGLDGLQAMMQLNNSSLVSLTHLFLQDMIERRSGRIVNIGSMISFMPVPYMAIYGATKVFVRFFTEALYEECKPYGVSVMFFAPGLTTTNFMHAADLNNQTGDALIKGAPTQTADQVADEFISAYTGSKRFKVSGGINRLAVRILSLIPNSFIASGSARTFRKRVKNN